MNFILIMHAPLAQAMDDVLQHVMPELWQELHDLNALKIIDICPHTCLKQQQQQINDYIFNTKDFIFCLNDLFGATPYRLMNESIEKFKESFPEKTNKIKGLTGVNIPIFLRSVKNNAEFFSWDDFTTEITKNNACII